MCVCVYIYIYIYIQPWKRCTPNFAVIYWTVFLVLYIYIYSMSTYHGKNIRYMNMAYMYISYVYIYTHNSYSRSTYISEMSLLQKEHIARYHSIFLTYVDNGNNCHNSQVLTPRWYFILHGKNRANQHQRDTDDRFWMIKVCYKMYDFIVLRSEYSERIGVILWPKMPWSLASPGHQ